MSVGMPAGLWLEQFGSYVWDVFGNCPYLVGSALEKKEGWRDVDVRVLLDDEEWERWFPGVPPESAEVTWHRNGKWVALTLAFSELGKKMTGLPIDFQIQPQTYANTAYPSPWNPRSALGLIERRMAPEPSQPSKTNAGRSRRPAR